MSYWLVLRRKYRALAETGLAQQLFELGLSSLVGLMVGALLVFSSRFSVKWQEFIAIIPIAFTFVMLVNDLEKLVLATIAISVPLSLDVTLISSPYAPTPEHIAMGHRTIVGLTELRLSLILVLVVIGYALWIIRPQGLGRKPVQFFAGTSIPALGFIFFSILSVFQAQDWQMSLFRVVQLFELFLVYFYLANHLRTAEDVRFFLMVSMWGMFAESILMIVQWITGLEFVIAGLEAATYGPGRVGGTFGNPASAGGYLSAHLLIALATIWVFPKTSQKIFATVCFAAGLVALIGTGSRAGWIGFAVTLLVFISVGFWRKWMQGKTLVLLAVAVLIILGLFYPSIHARLIDEHARISAESRPMMYRLAWNVIKANMWLGVGANNYGLVTRDYYTPDVGDLYVIDVVVHNRYLLIWAENGLFGLLFYVSFLLSPLIQMVQYIIGSDDRSINLVALGLGCALVSLCIQMFSDTFHVRSVTLFVWLLPGLMAGLQNFKQTHS